MSKSGVDTAKLQRLTRELVRVADNQKQELGRVLATARRIANTESKKKSAAIYNLSQSRIAKDLRVNSDPVKLQVQIIGQGRPISAAQYKGRSTKKGYRFQVLKSAAAVTIRRGFVQSKVRIPLMRVGKERFPIVAIYGPSVPDMLANPKVSDPLLNETSARTEKEIVRLTQVAIEKASG